MSIRKMSFAIGLLALGLGSVSVARAEHQNACAGDIKDFCGSVDMSDHKAVHACLKEHKDNLSSGCQQQMTKFKAKKKSVDATAGTTGTTAPVPAQ